MKSRIIFLCMTVILATAGAAMAQTITGQWTVNFYLEPNLSTAATQGICFKSDGTWYSTTFSNWNGDWFKKGDRIRWYGDTGTLGTAEFGQFVSPTRFTGEFAHFRAPGTPPVTSSRGNYNAVRVGSTCGAPRAPDYQDEDGDPAKK